MRRREFLGVLGGAVVWPLAARAQQAAKLYRVGYLGVTSYAEYAREIEACSWACANSGTRREKIIGVTDVRY